MKQILSLAILAVLAVLACVVGAGITAAASEPPSVALHSQARDDWGIVELAKRLDKPQLVSRPIPLPTPTDPTVLAGQAFVMATPGPMVASESTRAAGPGAPAILSGRGGGFSTPRERADRAIRRVIRRLD